jgi:hypothetical protein
VDEETGISKRRFAQTYTWVEWHGYNDMFTAWPDYKTLMIMYDDDYFRNHTWIWDGKPHWAYDTEYLKLENDRNAIEWTPNTIESEVSIKDHKAMIILSTSTPNLKGFQMRGSGGNTWKSVSDTVVFTLQDEKHEFLFRTVNLANITGPEHKVSIVSD